MHCRPSWRSYVVGSVLSVLASSAWAQGGLPPVPVPPQNPITEPKRVLGKILFWEEQMSSDNTVACGTCHRHESGSTDPRVGTHPGADGIFGNFDDVLGSPGIRRQDASGDLVFDPIFGFEVQVTGRAAQGFVGNQWAQLMFWDGRASSEFRDPVSGVVLIPNGGALESQSVGPPMSDVEMAHENRTWNELTTKLAGAQPLALASNIPPDMAFAIATHPSYGDLFAAAFGSSDITAARIAMAIATYERTLIPDQTPWDLGTMTPQQQQGFQEFQVHNCAVCHAPPFFTDHSFRNIGLRDPDDDGGRFGITGNPADRGRFKAPSLRNAGLRDRLMHTGDITDVSDAIAFYRRIGHQHFTDNQDPLVLGGINMSNQDATTIAGFISNALTDPRAAQRRFASSRPDLFSDGAAAVPSVGLDRLGLMSAPDPFRDDVTIAYAAAMSGPVELAVYDAEGRVVRRLVNVGTEPDRGRFQWDGRTTDGRPVSAGVYFAESPHHGGSRHASHRPIQLERHRVDFSSRDPHAQSLGPIANRPGSARP
ncbi:MAG: cytochrome c peroxidase [Candidatus Eisenbacteria bacterium]